MKWSLLFAVFISLTSFGQVNKSNDLLKKLKAQEQLIKGERPNKQLIQSDPRVKKLDWQEKLGTTARDSSYITRKIVRLPQDNMPCVVPNMQLFRAMPNAGDSSILKYPVDPGIYVQKHKQLVTVK